MVPTENRSMYSRTQNDNGTYNTRCLYCFMTVASATETEETLAKLESEHICPERALAQLQANANFSRGSVKRTA